MEVETEMDVDAIDALDAELKVHMENAQKPDKTITQVTEQRKEERSSSQETLALTNIAIELIGKAKKAASPRGRKE